MTKLLKKWMWMLVLVTPGGLSAQTAELDQLKLNIQKACPKQWEDLYSDIELNPNVLDIWQGDLTDKAQFVQYANEPGADGNARLLDANGDLLIDNYNDVVTIMTECGAQRVSYYKTVRKNIGLAVGDMVSTLTSQTAFSRRSVAGGVDYSDWVDGTTPTEESEEPRVLLNLAIGRPTSQSGTTSEELALLDQNPDPDVDYTEEEYGEMAENSGYAVNAVDNITDGRISSKSITYTGFQNQPFWQVELDTVSTIGSIVIYNRTDDCCRERLKDFYIMVSESPISKRQLSGALSGVYVVGGGPQPYFVEDSKIFNLPEDIKGKFVRIQLAGNNTVLSLAEVKVMGYPVEEAPNEALFKVVEAPE